MIIKTGIGGLRKGVIQPGPRGQAMESWRRFGASDEKEEADPSLRSG
jgi:hypothetical protein